MPILVRYVIGRETWFHDLGFFAVSYLSGIHFERFYSGYTTDCILGMLFGTWCIVKLDLYVIFFSARLILKGSQWYHPYGE